MEIPANIIDIINVTLFQGLLFSLPALAIMMPFVLLDLPDITCEASFSLAGCTFAALVISGFSFPVAMIMAVCVSGITGFITALLHLKLRVDSLLAGVIVIAMSYSVNLHIMGQPNIPLFEKKNIFSNSLASQIVNPEVVTITVIVLAILILLMLFFKTIYGFRLRVIGANRRLAISHGINPSFYISICLIMANCLAGLAGTLIVQYQSYADVNMGFGVLLNSLGAVMLGQVILGKKTVFRQLIGPVLGSITYQIIMTLSLMCGVKPTDMKLITGLLVITVIALMRMNHSKQGVAI